MLDWFNWFVLAPELVTPGFFHAYIETFLLFVRIMNVLTNEPMTKKEFKEMISVHKYGRGRDENNITAIFFDWKSGDKDGKYFGGYKYCVFARAINTKRDDLINILYNIVRGINDDGTIPYYIQLIMALDDMQRFKVPLNSGGLNRMIKYSVTN